MEMKTSCFYWKMCTPCGIGCGSALFPSSPVTTLVLGWYMCINYRKRCTPSTTTFGCSVWLLSDTSSCQLDFPGTSIPPCKAPCKEWSPGGSSYHRAWKTYQALTARHIVRTRTMDEVIPREVRLENKVQKENMRK
jgi:hypothetical protein